ncbi:MAG: 5'-nucleotidase C-terminal domain-containing protein [Myxococcota bacterium]
MRVGARLFAILTIALLTSSASAQLRSLARIFATAGVAGELATPVCDGAQTLRPAEIATRDVWTNHDPDASLLIDMGGMLARHGVARFAAEHDPASLAELVRSLRYRALAFGESDLGDPRELVLARARALRRVGVPYLATNLRCEESAAELCEVLVTGQDGVPIHAHGEQRIAILNYLHPSVGQRVSPRVMEGVRIEPLAASLRNGVRAAREAGATIVVAVVSHGYGAAAAARIVSLTSGLADVDKPDLVFASGAGTELLFARPVSFRPAVVAAPTRNAVDAQVRHNGDHFDILARPSGDSDVNAAFARFVERVGQAYCDDLADPLPGGRIDPERAMDALSFTDLVAGVMRLEANADVALLNRSAIDERWGLDGREALTASDVNIAIQYDEPLMVATVPAIWLRNLARDHADDEDFLVRLGLEITNPYSAIEKIKVNGRILDMAAMYDVVTIRFLAEGGDDGLIPGAEWEQLEDVTLRSAVLAHLRRDEETDPRDALPDPADRLEWTLRINTDLTFAGSAVRDDGDYQEGPLENANQTQFGINGSVGLNALSRRAAWENLLSVNYTLAATDGTSGFEEGADQLTYRMTGNYRGFRARLDELYVPDLVAEGLLRTELTQDEDRDDRFLNIRFAAGLQWRLHLKVQLKLLGGFEILEALSDEERSFEPGFGGQVNIDPWLLMRAGLRKLTLGLRADYFVSAPGDRNRHLLQGLFDLQLDLNRFLALSFNVIFYGLKEGGQDFSFATQTNVALRVAWTGRAVLQ